MKKTTTISSVVWIIAFFLTISVASAQDRKSSSDQKAPTTVSAEEFSKMSPEKQEYVKVNPEIYRVEPVRANTPTGIPSSKAETGITESKTKDNIKKGDMKAEAHVQSTESADVETVYMTQEDFDALSQEKKAYYEGKIIITPSESTEQIRSVRLRSAGLGNSVNVNNNNITTPAGEVDPAKKALERERIKIHHENLKKQNEGGTK